MEVDVETKSPAWISSVEAGGHYSGGDDEEEGYYGDYGVAFYYGFIAGHCAEAVSHACGVSQWLALSCICSFDCLQQETKGPG